MTAPYTRAPHRGAEGGSPESHAALLIDFDNVTMGMRSDLSKELKTLLDTDVIKGKVSVQRAYADWRRYPQYIVPLSEASVDLIFAPAYGSNKKNATDIRMAIDALELVFIRPEIGTFILLTGDSDFSSLVLKLKEYGKYVIGVGIQESSSDILVQNCNEYYSYTSLTGLTKTTEGGGGRKQDPWLLVKDAVAKMVSRGDVMRSDRLKQVMQEIDSGFDEGSHGFSKFSKFLAEAASRNLLSLTKVGNGQYEVGPASGGSGGGGRSGSRRGRGGRGRSRNGGSQSRSSKGRQDDRQDEGTPSESEDPLQDAYETMKAALLRLRDAGREPARDSDVKRKMLEDRPNFDETELGFPKFSKFLAQAEEHGVIRLERGDAGNLNVALADAEGSKDSGADRHEATSEAAARPSDRTEEEAREESGRDAGAHDHEEPAAARDESTDQGVIDLKPSEEPDSGFGFGLRRGSTRRRSEDDGPPLFEGQMVGSAAELADSSESLLDSGGNGGNGGNGGDGGDVDLGELGLPSEPDTILRYLTNRYKGVGEKTAETLVDRFGTDLFRTLHEDPDAVTAVVPAGRAEQVLEAWRSDFERRTASKR